MGRKPKRKLTGIFHTKVNPFVLEDFRLICKENHIPMNMITECFMRAFNLGQFQLTITNNKVKIISYSNNDSDSDEV